MIFFVSNKSIPILTSFLLSLLSVVSLLHTISRDSPTISVHLVIIVLPLPLLPSVSLSVSLLSLSQVLVCAIQLLLDVLPLQQPSSYVSLLLPFSFVLILSLPPPFSSSLPLLVSFSPLPPFSFSIPLHTFFASPQYASLHPLTSSDSSIACVLQLFSFEPSQFALPSLSSQ